MEFLLAVIIGLFGALIFENKKRQNAEASKENLDTKKKINEIEKTISQNNGSIEFEEQKREKIKNEKVNVSLEEVARYFNDRDNSK